MTNQNSKLFKLKSPRLRSGYKNFAFCILIFKFARKREGFTLIETVVAVGLLIAATVSSVALISQSLFSFPFARNKLIALNLAQEGMELARLIRDQNMQCVFNEAVGWTWDRNFNNTGTMQGSGQIMDATDDIVISCSGIKTLTFRNPRVLSGNCGSMKIKLDASGRYGYVNGQDTAFSRCIDISNPSSADPNAIPQSDMLDVTSVVSWSEHGIPRSVTLGTRMYNWKKP